MLKLRETMQACASMTRLTIVTQVYFPSGTYLVSAPIIDYYYTQIIGNPNCMPVIKASSTFTARWVIDGDAYQPGGALGWGSTNVFWRQIRNLIVDTTSVAPNVLVAGIHWPTAQATSLQNIVFKMSSASSTQHEGIFVESGSGGFVTDLSFFGGLNGITVGNQQFTMRNLTFNGAVTAINQLWDWGWTYKGISINNCGTGLNIATANSTTGALAVGSIVFIDSDISNTPVGISTGISSTSIPATANSLILENVRLNNVPVAVQGAGSSTILAGSTGQTTISGWGQGHSYTPTGPNPLQNSISPNNRPASLVAGSDYYERSKPQYESVPASGFVSVRANGAVGDGSTADDAALNAIFAAAAISGKIVYIDHGDYLVTKTIHIPSGVKIVGEAYPVILSSGDFFSDINNPQPVVQVGNSGETGSVEFSDVIVSSKGAQAGAILIEWNLAASASTPAGLWDVHTRVGGFAGSELQLGDCPTTPGTTFTSSNVNTNCIAAFMSLHITSSASGLYMENNWLWVADHDVEDPSLKQITIYAGRGLLIESEVGGIWLVGTAVEHHQLYQYQLSNTKEIFLGQVQTETAYYQPNPDASTPFSALTTYNDPIIPAGGSGWGLRLVASSEIFVYGAGLYSFFSNNDVHCSDQDNSNKCQSRIFSVESSTGSVYNLNTVGATDMITKDGVDVASFGDNPDGFISTIALFRF
jgi:glucan 1,3-beta-glucosidase